ncbi:MAG: class I SAM-dependent methyltransferase, partial [Pseudomonadota bacterium]
LEIGCRTGASFAQVKSKTIGVDPYFRITSNVMQSKPSLTLCQQTSDAFFESGLLGNLNAKISVAFLDGMHLFEYLLRDFIQTERHANPKGLIFMHDCLPFNEPQTTRDLDDIPKGSWTGDVWKLVPILTKYRPDLRIDLINSRPTGLVCVRNLDPSNSVLKENYESILEEFADKTPLEFGPQNILCDLKPVWPVHFIAGDPFAPVRVEDAEAPQYVTP